MSYDLTIRVDDAYSQTARISDVVDAITKSPNIHANGDRSFIYDDGERYAEIDIELVNEDGDNIEERGREHADVNCISMHVPYPLGERTSASGYTTLARAIALRIGWRVFDNQRDVYLRMENDGGM